MCWRIPLASIASLGCLTVAADDAPVPQRQDVLVVVGAPGTAEYGAMFRTWAARWEAAAGAGQAGWFEIGLEETESDRVELIRVLQERSSVDTQEPLWIVLIGHGTFDGRTAHFNLRGADLSSVEFAEALRNSSRPLAFIDCSSCSAPFINALSGPHRVIVTATKDGGQFQLARFGDAMSEAIGGTEADLDRDGQVSLLEAWAFAAQRTAEFYESGGRLATEHALLDDNGDGLGSRREQFEGVRLTAGDDLENPDGRQARRWHLVRSPEERRLTPEQRQRRNTLEIRLEELQQRRDDYVEAEYLNQLEAVLIPLAKLYQQADDQQPDDEIVPDVLAPR